MITTQYTEGSNTTNTDRLFWFKHLHLAQFLVLALANEFTVPEDRATSLPQVSITVFSFLVYAALLWKHHPFVQRKRWKYPVRLLSLFVVGTVSVLVFVLENEYASEESAKKIAYAVLALAALVFSDASSLGKTAILPVDTQECDS